MLQEVFQLMDLTKTLRVNMACLVPDEGLEHEFGEQVNLTHGYRPSGHISHYSLITPKAHLFHLALFDSATLSPHYSSVHG